MSWVIAGVTVGSAALGAVNASNQRKAQKDANQQSANLSAAQMQYSPWTGVNPQAAQSAPVTGDVLGGAVQGGLGGAMFGSALKKGMAQSAAEKQLAEMQAKQAEQEKKNQALLSYNPGQV